jgi:hypothetical protein
MTTSKFALVTLALLLSIGASHAGDTITDEKGRCSGTLVRSQYGLYIALPPEGACGIDKLDEHRVLAICKVGRICTVKGRTVDTGQEGVDMQNITSVSRRR